MDNQSGEDSERVGLKPIGVRVYFEQMNRFKDLHEEGSESYKDADFNNTLHVGIESKCLMLWYYDDKVSDKPIVVAIYPMKRVFRIEGIFDYE